MPHSSTSRRACRVAVVVTVAFACLLLCIPFIRPHYMEQALAQRTGEALALMRIGLPEGSEVLCARAIVGPSTLAEVCVRLDAADWGLLLDELDKEYTDWEPRFPHEPPPAAVVLEGRGRDSWDGGFIRVEIVSSDDLHLEALLTWFTTF